ncbi:MAG: phosphatidylglycerophosphatase A [Phycisphaerae bacterium]|nr:phosphatidylglycerophosphatase A [Phycisphaerae bacterium]
MGTGYLRPAPGTWGSAAACGVFVAVLWATGPNSLVLTAAMAALAVLATLGCVWLGDFMEKTFSRKDPSHCTLDEWAGQAIALLFLPLGVGWGQHGIAIATAFVTFRVFDIIKPPPARQAEKLPKGIGVVTDDLIAGLYANIASQLILKYLVGL